MPCSECEPSLASTRSSTTASAWLRSCKSLEPHARLRQIAHCFLDTNTRQQDLLLHGTAVLPEAEDRRNQVFLAEAEEPDRGNLLDALSHLDIGRSIADRNLVELGAIANRDGCIEQVCAVGHDQECHIPNRKLRSQP